MEVKPTIAGMITARPPAIIYIQVVAAVVAQEAVLEVIRVEGEVLLRAITLLIR